MTITYVYLSFDDHIVYTSIMQQVM